jgi:hypothetical protein
MSGSRGLHGEVYGSSSSSTRCSFSLILASISANRAGGRLFRISWNCLSRCCLLCLLISSILCCCAAIAVCRSFIAGGTMNVTGGYSPTLIRMPSCGTIFRSRSLLSQPIFAAQLYEWRKRTTFAATSRERSSTPQLNVFRSDCSEDVNSNPCTSTPSLMSPFGGRTVIFHPARSSAPYTSDAALLASASKGVNSRIAVHPAYGFNGSLVDFPPVNQLGITLGAVQTAKFRNDLSSSARLASTAFNFASSLVSSRFNRSACCPTASALSWALRDATVAASASSWAVLAEVAALPASLESSKKSASSPLRMHVSRFAIWDSSHNSPDTPAATRPAPSTPKTKSIVCGRSGGCIVPRLKSCSSSQYSQTTKTTSSTTPTATKNVQNPNHPRSDELESSRPASALLSADSSVMELHEGQARLAKLQLIVIIIVFSIGILTLIGIRFFRIDESRDWEDNDCHFWGSRNSGKGQGTTSGRDVLTILTPPGGKQCRFQSR